MSSFAAFAFADQLQKAGFRAVQTSLLTTARACVSAGVTSVDEMIGMDLSQLNIPATDRMALQVHIYIYIYIYMYLDTYMYIST
jgi:hypothetical protein